MQVSLAKTFARASNGNSHNRRDMKSWMGAAAITESTPEMAKASENAQNTDSSTSRSHAAMLGTLQTPVQEVRSGSGFCIVATR